MAATSSSSSLFLLTLTFISVCHLPQSLSQLNASQPIRFTVLEKSPPRTFVGSVFDNFSLADLYPDPKDQVNLRFSFRSSDPDSSYFSINETTGIISTSTKLLDRDTICAYLITCSLQFQVQILPTRYFQVFNIYVIVIDINDHTPTFTPSSLRLNISEADVPGKLFLLPAADDPDGGIDGIQAYRLEPNTTKFQLIIGNLADGSSDVRLRLMERLKQSEASSYSLVVVAIDGGRPSRTGSLSIRVFVVDSASSQQSLSFENSTYEADVAESLPVGTSLLQVQASYQGTSGGDPSSTGQMIIYGIDRSTQQNQPTYLGIDNRTGVIFIVSPLDHEKNPVVLVTVTATDRSRMTSLPAYSRVTVFVSDSNDNAPVITVTTLTSDNIAEVTDSSPIDSFVAYLGVTDADDGVNGQVTCSVNSTSFRLEPVYTDYKLKTTVLFGRDSPTKYACAVTCVDRGSPPLTSSVVVSVRLVLTGPVFLSDRTLADVYENNRIGDVIVTLNVSSASSDRDSRMTFGFSAIGDSPPTAIAVDSVRGVVTSNVVFRYDVRRQYSYVVTVTDARAPTVTSTSTLIVNVLRLPVVTGSAGSSTPEVGVVTPLVTPASAQENPGIKNTDTVIIAAVVCATVIVVVITVVVAVAIVLYRRNQQKALVSAAVQLAKGPSSVCSEGGNRLLRSVSSISSSAGSGNGDKRDSKLGSIREESFEDLQTTPTDEWPSNLPNYPIPMSLGLEASFRSQSKKGMYVRSVSHPENQHHHRRSARAARYNDRMAEDGSDVSRMTDGESSSCYSGSLTDSGRGFSLQDDSCQATTPNGSGQQLYSHPTQPPSQVFRQDSDCSASSSRPLVPSSAKFPIENKIYITNHFRDALPRHSTRIQSGLKRDQDPGFQTRPEANRREYFDARSRAGHTSTSTTERSSGHWAKPPPMESVQSSSSSPTRYDRTGEFTRSLYAGEDNLGFERRSFRKQTTSDDETGNEMVLSAVPTGRYLTAPEEETGGAVEGGVSDTFV